MLILIFPVEDYTEFAVEIKITQLLVANVPHLFKYGESFHVLIEVVMGASFPRETVAISVKGVDNDGEDMSCYLLKGCNILC